jgi:hypothetical protein
MVFSYYLLMKKTQKVLDCIAFIEWQKMTCDELARLLSEIEDLKWSDYEDSKEQDLDMYDACRDATLEQL